MICPRCKSEIKDETATFCEMCGYELDKDPDEFEEIQEAPVKRGLFTFEERENPLPWWRYLITIGVYFGIMEIGAFLFQLLMMYIYTATTGQPVQIDGAYTPEAANFINIWVQILTYATITAATVILLWKPILSDVKYSSSRVGKVFALIGIGIAGVYAANILCNILFTIIELFLGKGFLTGDSQNQQAIEEMIYSAKPLAFTLYAVVLVIGAPAVEELIFRKSLCTLLGKFKRIWRIVFSAVLFGSIHVVVAMAGYAISGLWELLLKEFILGFQYIAMGAVLASAYEFSNKNVVVSFTIHAINNLLSVIAIIYLMLIK